MVGGRQLEHAHERPARRGAPRHHPEQDQREAERPHHLDERVASREGGAEHHAVDDVDDRAEHDAGQVRDPVRPARVVDEVVGDQGARGADGAEREVQHSGGLVEHDHSHAGERIHASQREPEDDVRLEEHPVHAEHRRRREANHRHSRTP